MFSIPVYVHWTFGLIFIYILWYANSEGMNTVETIWLTILFMALFLCVLLHEYGHALAARRYGVKTRDIVLMPIGGLARLERMPEKPSQEFVVAIAGPLVNVVIAIVIALLIWLLADPAHLELLKAAATRQVDEELIRESGVRIPKMLEFAINLAATNIALVIFNMIPAFPMDGGRVFRALLSMRAGRAKATKIAAWLGQAIALLLVIFGLYSDNYMLALLGIFVIYAARAENDMVQTEELLVKFRAADIMRPNFTRLHRNDWMLSAIDLVRHGLERHFLVFDLAEDLVGMLEEEDILHAQRKPDVTSEVGSYMRPVEVVRTTDSLLQVHHLIRQQENGIIAVSDDSGIIGVIDDIGLTNFIRMQSV